MNIAEASAFRELMARVASLELKCADLTRRMDDQSTAYRAFLADVEKSKTLGLKKAANG